MKLSPPPPFDIHITNIQNHNNSYQFYGTWMNTPIHGTILTENDGNHFFTIHIPTQQPTIQWIDNKPQNITHHDNIPIIQINTTLNKLTPILQSNDIDTLTQKIQDLLSTYMNPNLYERRDHVINIIQYLYQQHDDIALRQPEKDIYDIYHRNRILWKNIQDIQRWTTTDHLILKDTWKNAPSIVGIVTAIEHQHIQHAYTIWDNAPISQHSYIESIRYLQRHEAPSLPCV